jgi:hypothetical protein
MRDSLYLFESVINSRWFLRTSIILFLTKVDVLKKKLPKVSWLHIRVAGASVVSAFGGALVFCVSWLF